MKNELEQNIDNKIKESFEMPIRKAPANLWSSIANELDKDLLVNKELDDKLKESFETIIPKKAPAALWSAIASDMDLESNVNQDLDTKVKEGFEAQPLVEAPAKIWAAINRQLNIDKTWTNISSELDQQPKTWYKRFAQLAGVAAALLLLLHTCDYHPLIDTGPINLVQNESNTSSPIVYNKQQKHIEHEVIDNTTSTENIIQKEQLIPTKKTATNTAVVATTNNNTNVANKAALITSTNTSQSTDNNNTLLATAFSKKSNELATKKVIEKKNKENINTIPTSTNLVASNNGKKAGASGITNKTTTTNTPENKGSSNTIIENVAEVTTKEANQNLALLAAIARQPLLQKISEEKVISFIEYPTLENKKESPLAGKLSVGAFVVVNSTMLLNEETKEGFRAPNEVKNYFGLAANYGIWASYRIIPTGSIVAEFSINADNKQGYGVYENGVYYVKEWVMKYNRVSLAYKHDLWTIDGKVVDSRITAQAGVYLGILREAKLFYNGDLFFDAKGEHNPIDVGFKIALGQEIEFGKFVVGYGLRSDIGAANIFKGNSTVSANENYTNVIHLGGYFTLGYKF